MRTSNLHFVLLQTKIHDDDSGRARFFVTTAYAREGFYSEEHDDYYQWETLIFPCDPDGEPYYWRRHAFSSRYCSSYEEAIDQHLELVKEYTLYS